MLSISSSENRCFRNAVSEQDRLDKVVSAQPSQVFCSKEVTTLVATRPLASIYAWRTLSYCSRHVANFAFTACGVAYHEVISPEDNGLKILG